MSVGFCRRRISHVKQKQGDQICWKYFIYIIIASLCFLAVQSDSVVFTNFFQFHVYLLRFTWILFIAFVALLKCSFLLQTLSTSVSGVAYFEISQQVGKKAFITL